MLPRNLNVVLAAVLISTSCYLLHRRTRTAIVVGEAIDLIDRYYVDPVDKVTLLNAAMSGMTKDLDPHSEYIPAQSYTQFQDQIHQEFAGIGIFVDQAEPGKPVRVVTPLVGSPALAAGLLPGDEIMRVDDEPVDRLDIREVSDKLKGPVGTSVRLVVRRGDADVELSVTRATIELESVIGDHRDAGNRWVYRLAEAPEIAYVRMTSFGDKTVDELGKVLADLQNDFDGLVLDLRGNGGGLLTAAGEVCDMFLDSKLIVSTRTRGDQLEDQIFASQAVLVDPDKKIAILIDHDSASASEIVAAALQDHHRAAIVGTRSYGKGTVQNILPLQYGQSALRLTVAKYYRPNGHNIHRDKDAQDSDEWGVTPDPGLQVDLDEPTLIRLSKLWREASYPMLKANAGGAAADPPIDEDDAMSALTPLKLDKQLAAAVEYLKSETANTAQ